jgi:hypothetical protein
MSNRNCSLPVCFVREQRSIYGALVVVVPDEEGVTAAQIDRGRAKPNGKGLLHVVMVGEW